MTWLKVTIHDDQFETDFNPITGVAVGKGRRVYHAQSDVPASVDDALGASAGGVTVDRPGDSYSNAKPNAIAKHHTSKRLSPRHFEVTVEYSDLSGGLEAGELQATPLFISSSGLQTTEEYAIDAEDFPVQNTAGEPFDRLPSRIAPGRIYRIEKYVNAAGKAIIESVEHTNNDGTVVIDGFVCGENTLLFVNASFEAFKAGAETMYKCTAEIAYNPRGWVDKVLNVGFSEIADGNRKDITQKDVDSNDVPVTKPWPLNQDGSKKSSPTDTPDYIEFFGYPLADWSGVPL
jgi:hypothetical protein